MSDHYNNPDLEITRLSCKIYKHISYFRYKTENVDYVLTYGDIDFVILKISSENVLLNII